MGTAAPLGGAVPKGHYAPLDSLPDWGGVWILKFGPPPAPPLARGVYAERYAAAKAAAAVNNGEFPRQFSYCTPPGISYQMGLAQYPIEFLFNPGRVTMLFEAWMQVRRVFTDGRPHPDDWEPTLYGHSTGHWEGDTLVIDTVGIKPGALITVGLGHSDKERVSERLHLAAGDPDTLVDEMTVTDPEALQQPWAVTFRYQRHRDWDELEFVCSENDRNPIGADGKAEFKP